MARAALQPQADALGIELVSVDGLSALNGMADEMRAMLGQGRIGRDFECPSPTYPINVPC